MRTKEQKTRRRIREAERRVAQATIEMVEEGWLGLTRPQVVEEFRLLERTAYSEEVMERLRKDVSYWPEEGYAAPNLQMVTAKRSGRVG